MKAQIISFHCVLSDQMGKVISSTFNHDVITHVEGPGNLLTGLAEGLQNLRTGEKRRIYLSAEQAYGFYDPDLVIEVPRKELSDGSLLEHGHQVVSQTADGNHKIYRVVQTHGDSVTLDANHPLAGQDLIFEIEATEARDATIAEIAPAEVWVTHGREEALVRWCSLAGIPAKPLHMVGYEENEGE